MDNGDIDAARSRRPSGAIFDCDGLLVDTSRCWRAAYRTAVAEAGVSLSAERLDSLSASLNGSSVELAGARLTRALGVNVSADVLLRALREAVEVEPQHALPGAERLLAALQAELPLAVASNGPAVVVDTILRKSGLRHFFSRIVTAEQTTAPKPDPAVYLEACRCLSIEPATAIAFEDSPMGAASARAAGIFLIGVPSDPSLHFDAEVNATGLEDRKVFEALGLPEPKLSR